MYRIDENTFIDDTLITCAEYQLFIDEMGSGGKHYQPDHWMTHQFPTGQGRHPILGVRSSDARTFCVWLSQRELKRWHYRLPTVEEALLSQLKQYPFYPLGYWLDGTETINGIIYNQFGWCGSVPVNPRAMDRTRTRARAIDLAHTHAHTIDFALALDHALERYNLLNRALDLTSDRTIHYNHTIDHINDLSQMIKIYLDLVTLQERIAGRSPAFEGIRIVKESPPTEKGLPRYEQTAR